MDISTTSNEFILLAEGQARRGENGEEVAVKLAVALLAVMREGRGPYIDVCAEFNRLLSLALIS